MRRIVLAIAFAAIGCAGIGCSRRLPDFERMRQQQRTDPYEGSRVFSDGMAMRVPPSGTVAHEAPDMPIVVTPDVIALGQHQFDVFCAVCHGPDGSGRSVMAANMPGNPPPSLQAPPVAAHSSADAFAVISRGRNRMPAYDWALPPAERWAVIAYMRTLQIAAASQGARPQ